MVAISIQKLVLGYTRMTDRKIVPDMSETSGSELCYSTATDEEGTWVRQEERELKPVIRRRRRLTHNERWLTSGTTPQTDDLQTLPQLSTEMLEFILDRLDILDLRLSDCTFNPDGSVIIPNLPKKRDPNARS